MVGEQYGAQVDQTARVFATQLDSTTDAQSVANALRQQIYTRPDLAMDLAQRIQQYEKGTSGLELSVNPILKEVRTANGVQYIDTGQAQINIMNADGTTVNVATVPSNRSGDALAGDAGYLNPDSQWAGSFPDQFSGFQGGPFGNFLPFGNFGGPFRHGSRNPIENMISGLLGRFIGQIGGFGGGNGWDYGDNWGGNYGQSPWLYQNPDYYQGSNWYPDSYYPNNYNVWNQNY